MFKKKFKIFYDTKTLLNGAYKNAARTGIYFTALNILKSMTKKHNLKITLCTTRQEENLVKTLLQEEFPHKKFDFLVYNKKSRKNKIKALYYTLIADKKGFKKLFYTVLYKTYLFWYNTFLYYRYKELKNYDAFFSPSLKIPDGVKVYHPKNTYIFLHDIIPLLYPQYFQLNDEDWYIKLLTSLNEKDYYFTNSEHTRKDFLEYFSKINPDKITNTYVGCNVKYSPNKKDLDRIKEKYNIPKDKKYLFSLCSLEPRKNLIRTVETFIQFTRKHNIDDLIFVMGGSNWKTFKARLNDAIYDLNTNKIFQIGYVDDEDLPILYSGAEWFTYTSQYEGFGSPVLEAMNCGCPVITSNNSSLPEVIGDCGIQIDWDSDEQHIQAYEKYYFDENLRKENTKKGRKRAKLFSWDKTVDRILKVMLKNKL